MHLLIIYSTLFLSIFLEGELFFTAAVVGAHHGHLILWIVIIIGIASTMTSDMLYFILGRSKGKDWITSKKKLMEKIEIADQMLEKRENTILLTYRFIYGFRTIIPILFGIRKIDIKKFFIFSLIGTIAWISILTGLGLILGQSITVFLHHIEKAEFYVIAALLFLGLIAMVYKVYFSEKSIN